MVRGGKNGVIIYNKVRSRKSGSPLGISFDKPFRLSLLKHVLLSFQVAFGNMVNFL